MKTIYCIPGLGANETIFSRLTLQHAELRPLRMVTPAPAESLESYASRLLNQIDRRGPVWLLGQSFGGMLAAELSRLCPTEMLILVSSAKARQELPWYGRLIGNLRLHRMMPLPDPKYTSRISVYMNGITSAEDLAVFRGFAVDRNVDLLTWSIDQALRWREGVRSGRVVQIHGTADRLLPARYVHPDYWIEGGGHFMIVNRAVEISAIIDSLVVGGL